jgi:hypothetical protein
MNEIECYAVKHKDGHYVSVGLTVIDAWRMENGRTIFRRSTK